MSKSCVQACDAAVDDDDNLWHVMCFHHFFVKEKELATRSYQELADHEMDLWIKVNHPLFSNLQGVPKKM